MTNNKIVIVLLVFLIAGVVLIGSIGQSKNVDSSNIAQNNQNGINFDKVFNLPAMLRTPIWPTAPQTINSPTQTISPTKFPILTLTQAPTLGVTNFISPTLSVISPTVIVTIPPVSTFTYKNLTNPARVEVYDKNGQWLATFTNSSYTVTLYGPERTFSESSSPYSVKNSVWVRLLPNPFGGTVDVAWLTRALADRSNDIIATEFQYLVGAPAIKNSSGLKIAGDASYGPLIGGSRQEGSDFNDYLGVTWTYPDGTVDPPESQQIESLDCSGFQRMVLGYRNNIPISIDPKPGYFPRRSFQMYAYSPGNIIIADNGSQVTNFTSIMIGDLVFFDGSTNDGTQIDHVGMYLGKDLGGHYRFISSRKGADGPTIGDISGASILDGTGHYAKTFRGVRRL